MTCILIAGNPRSGTTVTARILHELGVFMGEQFVACYDDQWAPSEHFYADSEVQDIVDAMRKDIFGVPCMAPTDPLLAKLRHLIAKREQEYSSCGLKLYGVAYVLPYLAQIMPDMRIIHTRRKIASSVNSWHARMSTKPELGHVYKLVNQHEACLQQFIKGWTGLLLTIDFDTLIDQPEIETKRLASFAGKEWHPGLVGIIDPDWRRF